MNKNKLFLIAIFFFGLNIYSNAQKNILSYIKIYFNHPVDNSFSKGVNATYVHNAIMDTIAAYINRAKYTVDIAQYDYTAYSGDTAAHIANALNNAYSRGVKVRWIYDGSAPNSGVSLFNSGIRTLASPTSGSCYAGGIMHNKFIIIDEFDSLNAIVSTGSPDWSSEMNDHDYNNLVFIQSKVLARAFTNEFNIMWGDTTHGAAPNSSNEKFETCKPNSGTHVFSVGGSKIELYFSPSDAVNTQVINTINSANNDMYFAMYDFTQTQYSTPFVNKNTAGVYTSSIIDQYSTGFSSYNALAALPNFVEYTGSYIYHNKFITIDPSNSCSDPLVLTGSMNWTAAGYDENDENTIIIHNDTIANLYLQSYAGDYEAISGMQLTKQTGCTLGLNTIEDNSLQVEVYPNPFKSSVTISYTLATEEKLTMEVYNMMGQKIVSLADGEPQSSGEHIYHFNWPVAGIYLIKIQAGQQISEKKIIRVE